MDIRNIFLKLTEYTTPYGTESELEPLIPGLSKDQWGNYYKRVGKSETLFTCHLDNYCKTKEKVTHVIEGDLIKTDGTTILGADNKAGVVALLYMIEKGVPGFYYFFLGEEPILSGGCWGSSKVASGRPKFLSKFKRAVAFDRKQKGSIITRQMAQECCSNDFADALVSEFGKSGVQMKKDPTGYYTDTGNFIELIPECTNISIGVWNEHHNTEYVDWSYVEEIAEAACKVDWESLPSVRKPRWWLDESPESSSVIKKYTKFSNRKEDSRIFLKISSVLDDNNYLLMNRNGFEPGREMIFNHWFEPKSVKIVVSDGKVTFDDRPLRFRKSLKKAVEGELKKDGV